MKIKARKNPRLIFILLGLYILAQFIWWTNLLIKYNPGKTAMVIGEGAVFLALLTIGIFQIYKTFRHEIELARVQKNFLLSVTHELKTPVAATKLFLQTLLRHEFDAAKRKEIIEKSIQENDRLAFLIDNLLLVTSLDNKEFPLQFSSNNLSQLVTDISHKFKETIGKDHNWEISVQGNVDYKCDPQAIASVVQNLLENAVKYSPKHSTIKVSLFCRNEKIFLEVADEGSGVQKGDEIKIFEKFFRSGNEEVRSARGTGLGLFIVKNIVDMHGGEIAYAHRQPTGSIFTLSFNKK